MIYALKLALILGIILPSSTVVKGIKLDPLSEFSDYEVVHPVIRGGSKALSSPNLWIELPIRSRNVTLVLHRNSHLVSQSYIEKHYGAGGRAVVYRPNASAEHCYYHGVVEGDVTSLVAISTCQGLRGMVICSLGSFHLEPTGRDWTGPHYLLSEEHKRKQNRTCGVTDEPMQVHNLVKRSLLLPLDSTPRTRIVEMYVVNDNTQYKNLDSDENKVIQRTKEIINVASALYRAIDTHIALVGIEIWKSSDQIEIIKDADKTMNNFLEYRRQHITPYHSNDNAQLITGHEFDEGVIGKAPIKTICSWQYSGGVNMDHSTLVGPVATTVAHELGHNFGLNHDTDSCRCNEHKCIMNSNSGSTQPLTWSSCSHEGFSDAFHQGLDYCLHNMPAALYDGPVCGNGFLEPGEECDCGLPQACKSRCCDAKTCRLHKNATCASGKCCNPKTCEFHGRAHSCRAPVGPCDVGEFCKGDSEFCPSDHYVQDGHPCAGGEAYCYQGLCRNRESQCNKLWGPTGHEGNSACYTTFNTHGAAAGNCGFNWVNKTFVPCADADVFCGMLHCTHLTEKLAFWIESLQFTHHDGYLPGGGHSCYGIILDVGLDMEDPGMVPSGAKCGHERLCLNRKCRPLSDLNAPQCPDCHGHGVCDNHGLCYCDKDWGPPTCKNPGEGGSTHSGPRRVHKLSRAYIISLVVFCLVVLPLLIVTGYFVHKYRAEIKVVLTRRCRPHRYRTIRGARPPQAERPKSALSCSESTHGVKRASSFTSADIGHHYLAETTNPQLPSLPELPATKPCMSLADAHHDTKPPLPPPPLHPRNSQSGRPPAPNPGPLGTPNKSPLPSPLHAADNQPTYINKPAARVRPQRPLSFATASHNTTASSPARPVPRKNPSANMASKHVPQTEKKNASGVASKRAMFEKSPNGPGPSNLRRVQSERPGIAPKPKQSSWAQHTQC